jgi:purine-binding chemotaxis protein CheW
MDSKKIISDDNEIMQLLAFNVNQEEFAIDIMVVREIKSWSCITRLPNSPEYLLGVLNLRGVIIPIFDLKCRFGKGLTDIQAKTVVVITAVGTKTVGMIVDNVSDILNTSKNLIAPAPHVGSDESNIYISGLISMEKRIVVVLDLNRLFGKDVADLKFD